MQARRTCSSAEYANVITRDWTTLRGTSVPVSTYSGHFSLQTLPVVIGIDVVADTQNRPHKCHVCPKAFTRT